MALYEILETRLQENRQKPVRLYDLLEQRIKERQHSDELFRLLAKRLRENGSR